MIVSLPDDAVGRLVDLALAEAERHRPQTRERRAAAALMVALADTKSVSAARKALAGFCDKRTRDDALALLGRLVASHPDSSLPVAHGEPVQMAAR